MDSTPFSLLSLLPALVGGMIIGMAATVMLFLGKISGISGIVFNCCLSPLSKREKGWPWRLFFLLGLWMSGLIAYRIIPPPELPETIPTILLSGLLVGYGTQLSGGCTSGHGVCGISRLSKRSIVATLLFLFVAMVTATTIGWSQK